MISIIDNPSLAETGRQRMRWFMEQMPLIASLKETYRKEQPFRGLKVAICLHVEPKTAFWIDAILTGGAEHIYLVGCLGTTKPDTAAYLASDPRITVLAKEKDTLEDRSSTTGTSFPVMSRTMPCPCRSRTDKWEKDSR